MFIIYKRLKIGTVMRLFSRQKENELRVELSLYVMSVINQMAGIRIKAGFY